MKELPSQDRYIRLAEKWLNGTITPEEEREYAEWYNTIDENENLDIPTSFASSKDEHRKKLLQQINNRKTKVVPMYRRLLKVSAAAILIILVGTSLYYYSKNNKSNQIAQNANNASNAKDIKPGIDGAILTLSNGKTIVLDTAKNGDINLADNATATKNDGNLVFADAASKEQAVEYYTLTTPRARQQKLTLPDGTELWLNAVSSIKFPSVFTGKNRKVEVTGEAYFEVAKDASKPFIVNVNDASIEVLGTHFNIMAYNNENVLQTTLLEGSVKFNKGQESVMLTPGQQTELYNNGNIKLNKNVNVDVVTAWKNGMQSFDGADIKTIMRQVERWYDVDITYSGNIPAITFSGDIPRNANLSELLKLFKASKINFEIDKTMKKITVTP